jgi:CHAT domain-containing protein
LLYLEQSKFSTAEPYLIKSYQITKLNILDFYEMASQEQRNYFHGMTNNDNILYSFALNYPQSSSIPSLLFNDAILSKGLQLQTDLQLQNYLRESKDSNLVRVYDEYIFTKQQLNLLKSKQLNQQSNIPKLEEKAESLYKDLARKSAEFRNYKESLNIGFLEVQKKLKNDEVAIEYVNFKYHNQKWWTDSTYYVALVLRKEWTTPRIVYLCEQRQLDSLFSPKINKDISVKVGSKAKRGVEVGDNKLDKNWYDLIWKPIDSLLVGVKKVYFSPSGTLHRINLSAINTPVPKQRLMDKYEFIQLSSTRVLAKTENEINYINNALLLGGIEYNRDSLEYQKANESLGLRSNRGNGFSALPFTSVEIDKIAKTLSQSSYQVNILTGIKASEEGLNFYSKPSSPRILHFATHGFFLEDTLVRKYNNIDLQFDKEPVFVTSANPMLRSGLVLAGGNDAWSGKAVPQNQGDGILTAEEISLMNLRNTELVVLSACETGLGDIKGTEGVFGLQRAFKIAGVKYLIMSLWQVSDQVTSQFMNEFYTQYLKNKKPVREAFQVATNNIRKNNPDKTNLWAAFVLVE